MTTDQIPRIIIRRMLDEIVWTLIRPMKVLNPFAEKGGIVDELIRIEAITEGRTSFKIDCCEEDSKNKLILKEKGCFVTLDDFMGANIDNDYDLVISAIPSGDGGQVIIKKMWESLSLSGQLIIACPKEWMNREDKTNNPFISFVDDIVASYYEIPGSGLVLISTVK